MAIGYDPSKVKVAPTSFKSLLTGSYKNQVAIDGNPTQTGSAFAAVYAAALANGGSLGNIAPGVTYFKDLKAAGNFVPVEGTPATVQSGQTPILIWWDYLLTSEVKPVVKNLKIVIPSDGVYAGYYDQAISATAPDPAAARLWEEYLYSTEGQNLFLQGSTRPIELAAMITAGTVDKTAARRAADRAGSSSTLTLPTIGAADARQATSSPSSGRLSPADMADMTDVVTTPGSDMDPGVSPLPLAAHRAQAGAQPRQVRGHHSFRRLHRDLPDSPGGRDRHRRLPEPADERVHVVQREHRRARLLPPRVRSSR